MQISRSTPNRLYSSSVTFSQLLYSPKQRLLTLLGSASLLIVFYWNYGMGMADIYQTTPFCNAEGVCGESPSVATTRTIYSARSKGQYEKWMDFAEQLNRQAQDYSPAANKLPLFFWGDSITEAWLGTSYGTQAERAKGIPTVFQELLQSLATPREPLIQAISGDQTQHLLWRMQSSRLPTKYWQDPAAIHVVLIGTNNLGSGELPGPTTEGILAVAKYLLEHSKGKILLLEVLPRGDNTQLRNLCPPRCNHDGQPFESFTPAVDKVNAALRQQVEALQEPERLVLLSLGEAFTKEDGHLEGKLFTDRLHPNVKGQRIMAESIRDAIDKM